MGSDSTKKASVRADQILFMRGVVAGGMFLVLVALVTVYGNIPRPDLPTVVDRLVFTLQWQAISALTLIAGQHSLKMTIYVFMYRDRDLC